MADARSALLLCIYGSCFIKECWCFSMW